MLFVSDDQDVQPELPGSPRKGASQRQPSEEGQSQQSYFFTRVQRAAASQRFICYSLGVPSLSFVLLVFALCSAAFNMLTRFPNLQFSFSVMKLMSRFDRVQSHDFWCTRISCYLYYSYTGYFWQELARADILAMLVGFAAGDSWLSLAHAYGAAIHKLMPYGVICFAPMHVLAHRGRRFHSLQT